MIQIVRYMFIVFSMCTFFFAPQPWAAMDSRGTEFMFAFPPNHSNTGNLSLFLSSEQDAAGTVEIAGLNFVLPFQISANEVMRIPLPSTAQHTAANSIRSLGVRVIANQEVTVYGLNQYQYTTDAFLALPVDVLGLEYLNISYQGVGGNPSQMLVVGAYDNTELTIIPTAAAAGRAANTPFNITLNAGESYLLEASGGDLTGSSVTANAPIAVMGASKCVNIPVGYGACDHIVEMLPPVATWGQSFITIPLASRKKGDVFRVLASQDNTQIVVNGAQAITLKRGQHHEMILTAPSEIEASAPVLVAQYSPGQSFDGVISDPFMMLIPPSEQFLSSYDFVTLTREVGFNHSFVNVMAPTSALDGMVLDGQPVDRGLFHPVGQSGFSAAQIMLEPGAHSIRALESFGIYVYGFGSFDSYGYPGGMSFDFINPHGDSYAPNVRLELFGDYIVGRATDSEDVNANGILDIGEDINANGEIDRRSEDVNGNGVLDDGEDLNGNGVLDRDAGIFRVELEDATNLTLDFSAFVPGSLAVDFIIRRIDSSQPASGNLRVIDGAGNIILTPINFFNEILLSDVRVISTFSNNQIELLPHSFSIEPVRIESKGDKTEVEWQFDHFPVDQIRTIRYDLLMHNPIAGETRLVLHELEMTYADVNGNPVSIFLGTRAVKVAPSVLLLSVLTDKIRYRAGETVVINNTVRNASDVSTSARLLVNIMDEQGALVGQVIEQDVFVDAQNSSLISNSDFSVGQMLTGRYRVQSQIVDKQGKVLRQAEAPFVVVTDADTLVDLASAVYTQQPVYAPWDKVDITARLQNMASNSTISDVAAELRVIAPNGQILLQENLGVGQIAASAVQQFSFFLQLDNAYEGEYQVVWTARDGQSQALATSMHSFKVKRQLIQEILGEVNIHAHRIYHTGNTSCSFNVQNRSKDNLDYLELASSLIQVDSEQLLRRNVHSLSLAAGYTEQWSEEFDAANQPYGGYACVLEANINGTWQVLASASFEVQPPKVSISISTAPQGRVLVLTDEPRQCSALEDIQIGFEFGSELQLNQQITVRLFDENGTLLDTEIVHSFDALLNERFGPAADMAVQASASGAVQIQISSTAQGLKNRYRVEVEVRRNFLSKTTKSWSFDSSCDRPFTLGELWEDVTLLGWKPWRYQNEVKDSDPFGPLAGPSVTAQNAYLEAVLQGNGWDYTLVHSAEDFEREHRLGDYSSYLLLAERPQLRWQVQKELREAVFAGKGLIVAGSFDKRNLWLEPALGVTVVGRHPWATHLNVREGVLGTQWSSPLAVTDTVQAVVLQGADVVADYELYGDNQTNLWQWLDQGVLKISDLFRFKRNAISHYQYGQGQSIYFGFDWLLQASDEGRGGQYEQWLMNALQQVQPAQPMIAPYAVVPVDILWRNERGATTAHSTLTLPAGATLAEPRVFEQVQTNQWHAHVELQQHEQVNHRIYVQLGEQTEQAIQMATYTADGTQQWQQIDAGLNYDQISSQSLKQTGNELDALAWRYWYRLDYRSAWLKFKLAREEIEHSHYYSAQDLLLLTSDLLLLGNEPDVAAVRQQIQQHIRLNGRLLATQP